MSTVRTTSFLISLRPIWAEHYPHTMRTRHRTSEDEEGYWPMIPMHMPRYEKVLPVAEPLVWCYERLGTPARDYRPLDCPDLHHVWDMPTDRLWDAYSLDVFFKREEDAALFKLLFG